jgi:hypothetical protein
VAPQLEQEDLIAARAQLVREIQRLIAVGVVAVTEQQAGAGGVGPQPPDVEALAVGCAERMDGELGQRVRRGNVTAFRIEELTG